MVVYLGGARKKLDRHDAVANEIKLVGFLTFPEKKFPGIESHVGRASDQKFDVLALQVPRERVFRDDSFQCFHQRAPSRSLVSEGQSSGSPEPLA